jgi:hypothetical protein
MNILVIDHNEDDVELFKDALTEVDERVKVHHMNFS